MELPLTQPTNGIIEISKNFKMKIVYKTLLLTFFNLIIIGILFGNKKPNIIWIYAEDTSPWMGCYGDEINKYGTPNIDFIAESGVMFNRAYVTAPVCSASRSSIIVGQSSIRFGGHQHRSSRSEDTRLYLPSHIKLLPVIMQENGYNTFNFGKADYNFYYKSKELYNTTLSSPTSLQELIKKQPFFGQIQTKGGKNNTIDLKEDEKVNPFSVQVPKDYPDNEVFKKVVAQHYDAIRKDDKLIGKILEALKETGLDSNTIVVYFSDHGANHLLRHKQMTTEGGLRVPFMIMGPNKYVPNSPNIRNDLVSMLDLSATTLSWAGIQCPDYFEGQDLFSKDFKTRSFVGAHRDRLDHTIDKVRSVRTDTFRYVRNYLTDRILLQPQYRDKMYYTKNLHELYKKDRLPDHIKQIYFGERPQEEFYNIYNDPDMIHNLAYDSLYSKNLDRHRNILENWISQGDLGNLKESEASLRFNGEGKKWGIGVNPEYEHYRLDSDGDGLSDIWETQNNRDPNYASVYFDFDCGGWQTEGWVSNNIKSNIAGFLGFLDFKLDKDYGSIERKKLNFQLKEQFIYVRVKTSKDVIINLHVNDKKIKPVKLTSSDDFKEIKWKVKKQDEVLDLNSLSVVFKGKPGTKIELDYIKSV